MVEEWICMRLQIAGTASDKGRVRRKQIAYLKVFREELKKKKENVIEEEILINIKNRMGEKRAFPLW